VKPEEWRRYRLQRPVVGFDDLPAHN
jgi:hypothetical protein